ncbi:MAG: hypothetical protein ACFCUN_10890 [Hyphomicrobiaceae bacterium]
MVFDILFILASIAIGLGLSLATYRIFAVQNEWPMGELHANRPLVPIMIGVFSLLIGFLFAAAREAAAGPEWAGWSIIIAGVLVAVFWTGFMRVAGQIALFLAPLATVLLMLGWIGIRPPSDIVYIPGYSSNSLISAEPLPLSPRAVRDRAQE